MFSERRHIYLCILLGVISLFYHPLCAAAQTVSFAGSLKDSNSNPVVGASIQMVGNSSVVTTSASDGSFTLTGLPAGEDFYVEVIPSGFLNLYSKTYNTLTNITGVTYTDHTAAEASAYGVDIATEGVIIGRVADNSGNYISGAIVSCTSKLHQPCTYTIEYGSPTTGLTATTSNGKYFVLNVDDGDTVTLSATPTSGLIFAPSTFIIHAGAESQGKIFPAAAPWAPTGVSGQAGNGQVTVSFTPPSYDGGSPITSYTATSSGKQTGSASSSPITVKGLTNGKPYTFTVTATNAIGTGPPSSPSSSVTPGVVPGAPTGVTAKAGNAQATVSFKLPASSGNPITGCTATSSPGGITGQGVGSPIIVNGLTNGTAYTFSVTATNAIGTGKASKPSNKVTPKP